MGRIHNSFPPPPSSALQATTNAMKNMTGVIQRTSHLISGGSAKSKAMPKSGSGKKGSRQDLASLDGKGPTATTTTTTTNGGGNGNGKMRRRKSRQQLAGLAPARTASPPGTAAAASTAITPRDTTSGSVDSSSGGGDTGARPKPHRLDLAAEDSAATSSAALSSSSSSSSGASGGGASTTAMADVVRTLPPRRAASSKSVAGLSPAPAAAAAPPNDGPNQQPQRGGRIRFLSQQQQSRQRQRQASAQQQQPQPKHQVLHAGALPAPAPAPPQAMPEAKAVLELSGGGADISSAASASSSSQLAAPPLKGEAISTPAQPIRFPNGQQSSLGSVTSSGGAAAPNSGPTGGGYIFAPLPDDCTPLLAFVNSRSGVSQGAYLIHQLRRLLNPVQVVDLANEDPARALRQFLELPRLRILVCGGDGTAKWIMNVLEELELDCWPPIAILPLGTGNDMARVLGWGGGYNNESIVEFLAQVQRAHVVVVDRWEMKLTPAGKNQTRTKNVTFNNYFGIGVDAQAALKFHHLREQKPQLFFSRLVNKLWYGMLGAQDLFRRTCVSLPERVKIVADGKELYLPPGVQGVIFLNIESYGGGVKLWNVDDEDEGSGYGYSDEDESRAGVVSEAEEDGDDEVEDEFRWQRRQMRREQQQSAAGFTASSMQDGLLEVVAVNGVVHLGQLQVGLSKAMKICQCREATITTTRDLPMQVDGEPWPQARSIIKIGRKKDPAYMLRRTMDSGGAVVGEVVELLESAVNDHVITLAQKKSLLTEFSRRVEVKRKVFEQELSQNEGVPSLSKTFDVSRLRLNPDSHPTDCVVS